MKRELDIIIEELRRLKTEGVSVVSVSDGTMKRLRQRVKGLSGALEPESRPREVEVTVKEAKVPVSIRELAANLDDQSAPAKVALKTPSVERLPPPPRVVLPDGDKQAKWEALRKQVLECPTCTGRVKPGRKVVFGCGSLDADILFIGEAPGEDDEMAGEPFVGKAGETLTKMIKTMGLDRNDVYITNIMNWKPPTESDTGHRAPTGREMDFCLPYLLAQIDIVKPKVLVALGNTVISGLFGPDSKRRMKDVRGHWKDFRGIPVLMTYHPAYLDRSGSIPPKRAAWEDLLQVMGKVGLEISDKHRGYFLSKR